MTDKLPIYCDHCHQPPRRKPRKGQDVGEPILVNPTSRGNPRPPRGWRVVGDQTLCPQCFGDLYATIAVTLPIVGTREAWESLSPAWQETTALANWSLDQLMAAETPRDPSMDRLPDKPAVYLYGLARDHYPRWGRLPAAASLAVLRRVEQDWATDRYKVLWTNERARRVYQYPQPYATGDFKLATTAHEGEERLSVQARLGDARRTLVLSRGKGFRRQRKTLEAALSGPLGKAALTELTLMRREVHEGDHRPDQAVPGNGGAPTRRYRIMAKIVLLIPRPQRSDASGTLLVKTHAESLIEALDVKGDRIWWLHADHARRLVAKHQGHLQRLQRLSDDRKHERRKPRRSGTGFREMVSDVSRRDARRIQQIADEVAASTVAFAQRRRYNRIEYDDRERSFAHNFRWAMLKQKLASKCHLAGIEFRERSGAAAESATARTTTERGKSHA